MSNFLRSTLVSIPVALSTTSCGNGTAGPVADAPPATPDAAVDAPASPYDLSCADVDWPTTAPPHITWAGRVHDLNTAQAVAGAAVEIRAIADDSVVASDLTDESGAFSFSLATGEAALAVYAHVTAEGYVPSSTYPPYALWSDQPARNVRIISLADRAALAESAGVTLSAGSGIVMVRLNDCAVPAMQVAGASVTFSPAAERTLARDGGSWIAGNTTTSDGVVAGVNIPAGTNDLTVSHGESRWRSWPVRTVADGFVYSPRRP
jgi:hypothetical protein